MIGKQVTHFNDYFAKQDTSVAPTLWVGTSLGSILSISCNLPTGGKEARKSEPVSVNPSGTIFRLKGTILCMSFLDCNGNILQNTFESWRDEAKDRSSKLTQQNFNNNPLNDVVKWGEATHRSSHTSHFLSGSTVEKKKNPISCCLLSLHIFS